MQHLLSNLAAQAAIEAHCGLILGIHCRVEWIGHRLPDHLPELGHELFIAVGRLDENEIDVVPKLSTPVCQEFVAVVHTVELEGRLIEIGAPNIRESPGNTFVKRGWGGDVPLL